MQAEIEQITTAHQLQPVYFNKHTGKQECRAAEYISQYQTNAEGTLSVFFGQVHDHGGQHRSIVYREQTFNQYQVEYHQKGRLRVGLYKPGKEIEERIQIEFICGRS